MPATAVALSRKPIEFHRALVEPDFGAPTAIADDPWNFVAMWLRFRKQPDALTYWEQAQSFSDAAAILPPRSAPLPAYYCCLNAAKALLVARKQTFAESHGVGSTNMRGAAALNRETVRITNNGILGALRIYLQDGNKDIDTNLKEILANLAFVQRAFTLTFSASADRFIPSQTPRLVRKNGSKETWFEFAISKRYASEKTLVTLGTGFERDHGQADAFIVRAKKRFDWEKGASKLKDNLSRLLTYHARLRRRFQYIAGASTLWYVRREANDNLDLSALTLIFAALHRLSELARYDPLRFERHLESQHNWLLVEFVRHSVRQFVDGIAAELTGHQILPSGIRGKVAPST